MNEPLHHITEQQAAMAFSRQSVIFDELYSNNSIIRYKRERVRRHLLQYLPAHGSILELNSGTGEDATWLANHGYRVHATDISAGMQEQLKHKVSMLGLEQLVTTQQISYTELDRLPGNQQYDSIFSNFAGLNCTDELDKVLHSFDRLLKPGGTVTLVLLPKFCLWETLLLFKGKFRTATRRFFSGKGRQAHLEGIHFKCWYYNPAYVKKHIPSSFNWLSTEGLCSIVPPSYLEGFAEKHPRLYRFLEKKEEQLKSRWPWKHTGDYYIISFRKKDQ